MQGQSEKAKNYAFLLLKFRPRSEQELTERLRRKKFDPEIIKEVLAFLKEKDFINDSYFAGAWIESRLKRPFGLRRIRQELKLKGVDKEIIEAEIERARQGYCEEDIVRNLTQQKLRRLKDIDPRIARARVYSYLVRRGFSPETIIEAINQ